jgi:cellulose 1,4-beta-cellobiosidase
VWGAKQECLTTGAGKIFTVASLSASTKPGRVAAYPNVFYGCEAGVCTPASGLPARVSKVMGTISAFQTSGEKKAGRYNASYDIWFSTAPMKTGQADGAELMIWFNAPGNALESRVKYTVGGVQYYLAHWRSHLGKTWWNYIQFRRVRPASGGSSYLKIGQFIQVAEKLRLVKSSWWMDNVEAGFEIWSGGSNVTATRFWAKARS